MTETKELDINKVKGELDKAVSAPKNKKPELNTYLDVLAYNLREIVKQKADVSYTQEVLIPIPEELVKEQDQGAKNIIKLAGQVMREESLDTDVEISSEDIPGRNGKVFSMINIVFKINSKEQATKILDYVKRGEK